MTTEEKILKTEKSIEIQINDVAKTSLTSGLILGVCLVDTLAGFYCGYRGQTDKNAEFFNAFVGEFMDSYSSDLYSIRCRLIHNYSNTKTQYWFVDDPEFDNIRTILGGKLFNVRHFRTSLVNAKNEYFKRVKDANNTQLRDNFEIRFNYLDIIEEAQIPVAKELPKEIRDRNPNPELNIMMVDFKKFKK